MGERHFVPRSNMAKLTLVGDGGRHKSRSPCSGTDPKVWEGGRRPNGALLLYVPVRGGRKDAKMNEIVLVLVPETGSGRRRTEKQVRDEAWRLVGPYVLPDRHLRLAALDLLVPEIRAQRPKARYDACWFDWVFGAEIEEADPAAKPRLVLHTPTEIPTYLVRDIPDGGPAFTSLVTPHGEHVCPWRDGLRRREEALERHRGCLAVAFTTHF